MDVNFDDLFGPDYEDCTVSEDEQDIHCKNEKGSLDITPDKFCFDQVGDGMSKMCYYKDIDVVCFFGDKTRRLQDNDGVTNILENYCVDMNTE